MGAWQISGVIRRLSAWVAALGITIACGAQAADIRTYPVERFGYRATHVVLEGDIVPGDAARLAQVIAAGPVVSDIELYSRGGDLAEAIALARLVKGALITAWTAAGASSANSCTNPYGSLSGARDPADCLCGSACAIVWMAAPTRVGTEVFVHRFWYPPEALAMLSAPYAAALYDRQTRVVRNAMDELGIPRALFDIMMSVPSSDARRLSRTELTVTLRTAPELRSAVAEACGDIADVADDLACTGRVTLEMQAEAQGKTLRPPR